MSNSGEPINPPPSRPDPASLGATLRWHLRRAKDDDGDFRVAAAEAEAKRVAGASVGTNR